MPVDTLMPDLKDRFGTARQALEEHLNENHKNLAPIFSEMTPEEKKAGKLVGKLLEKGFGNAQIDDAFTWWEQEHNGGEVLPWVRKNIALIEAINFHAQISGETGYRTLRKVLIAMNQK